MPTLRPPKPLSETTRTSRLLLRASIFAARCSQALGLADRSAAVASFADLDDALNDLEELDDRAHDQLLRLRSQRAKLAVQLAPSWAETGDQGRERSETRKRLEADPFSGRFTPPPDD
jgi:hypothetical protein